jgi:hypothetical protein
MCVKMNESTQGSIRYDSSHNILYLYFSFNNSSLLTIYKSVFHLRKVIV